AFKVLDQYDYLWHETGLIDVVRSAFAKHGAYFLGPIYSDEWGSTMSRNELKTLDDFKGLKIRSFGLGAEVFKSKGASIVTIPGEEQYTALSTGVIDATNWGSPAGMYQYKLYEPAKFYLGPSTIAFDTEDMFMNMRAFNRLPKDLQEIMRMCVRVYALERASTSTAESARVIEPMKAAGVKFSKLPEADIEYYEKTAYEALDRMQTKDADTQKVLKIIFETRDLFRKRPSGI
ncbi:MAG: TRAP transporter substrate-binding protein DctP, partial [Hyphomicrobiaceae bacterium]